jgi:SEC-C motif-containing protein
MTACYCSSGHQFDDCCGPLLAGAPAPTAEALMRSRYCAWIKGNVDYLESTLAPEAHEPNDRDEMERMANNIIAAGLDMRFIEGGKEGDETGIVEYVARFKVNGQLMVHHERSHFRRHEDRWVYVDGDIDPKAPPRRVEKIGRNDPCSCGSGKKYKKCCGNV